jgi:hypothetical protein
MVGLAQRYKTAKISDRGLSFVESRTEISVICHNLRSRSQDPSCMINLVSLIRFGWSLT